MLILFVAAISILTTKVPDTFWTSSYDAISKHTTSFITSLDLSTRTSYLYTSSLTFFTSITYITWSIFLLGITIGLYLTYLLQNEWYLLKRRSRIYYVAARVIGGYLWLKYSQKLCRTKEPALTTQWERAHEKYAALVQHHIVTLQGFWIKVGQYLSSRADVVPEAWIRELSKLQDSVPASSYQHVASVIHEDFGAEINSLFSSFEETPLAAASIAQVHKAVLKDGTKVVAKVQHPNIATIMPSDFVNLARITSWVAYFEPDFDFTPVLREWSTEAIKELDFNHESHNMQRVQSNLATSGLNVVLPSIIPGLVSARVIVMTFMDGFKITDTTSLDKYGIDRLQLLRRIAQAYAHQIYIDGFFNADPHPGNILVQIHQGKVRPVLLDFGLTKELPVKMRHAFAMMVSSVADANYGGLLTAFSTMGLQLKRDDPLEDMRAIRFLLRDTAPPKEARAEIMKWREEMEEKRNKLPKKLRNPVEAWPGELLFFFRVTLLIRGLCSALQVRLPTMEILAPYAKMSLIRRYEIHDHAMSIIYPTPILSPLEAKIRTLLTRLYAQGEFVGLQVCVYHRDKKIVDTSAGTLGVVDPRPVRPDTLFNSFSVTKGVCAVLLHMLADRRYAATRIPGVSRPIDFNQLMTSYWPAFGQNGKQTCTVAQAISHQAGLQNAVSTKTPIDDMIQWDVMMKTIEQATPVTPPGVATVYHYLAYGFIVGGLVQHVTGRHIRQLVHDHIAMPLGIEHEMMMGLEEGMNQERRLATLSNGFFNTSGGLPTGTDLKQMMTTLREMRSKQNGAGSVAGAASAFFGTRRPQSFTFNMEHKYDSNTSETADAAAGAGNEEDDISALLGGMGGMMGGGDATPDQVNGKPGALTLIDPCLFNLSKLRTACIPAANGHFSARALARLYACLACHGELDGVKLMSPEQVMQMKQIQTEWAQVGIKFGLGTIIYGFEDSTSSQPRYSGFGHSGLGGSLGFCDTHTGVSVAIMVNKLSFHKTATNELVQLIASELGMGQPLGGQLR